MDKVSKDNLFIPASVVILLTLLIGFTPIPSDPDLWFHLADGDYILKHGQVPQADTFSFTKTGELWVPHSWLFDVATTLSWRHLGPRSTEGIMAFVFMSTMLISFNLLTWRGINPLAAAGICVWLAVAAGNTRGIRPQVFTLLLCNVVLFLLVRHRDQPRRRLLIYLPLIFLIWAQLHSACVMGLIVAAIWLAGRAFDTWRSRSVRTTAHELLIGVEALALSAVAVLITPHAITHFHYVALTMNLEELKLAGEWQMPQLFPPAVPDIHAYLLIAVVAALLIWRRRRPGWAELGLCGSLVLLALTGLRHIPLAAIASVPFIAEVLAKRGTRASADLHQSRNYPSRGLQPARTSAQPATCGSFRPVAVLTGLAVLLLLVSWEHPTAIQDRYAQEEPVNGARALRRLVQPLRVFTTYNTGSYILWTAPEHLRVFVDSRADLYGDEVLFGARRAMNGQGWQVLFDHWGVDGAVV
ncbi:MAG: hypothetical protein KJ749_12895, partial [Planctomycetes bacterium]|nr:hypothetical protein [Planctomycetota bacterium]